MGASVSGDGRRAPRQFSHLDAIVLFLLIVLIIWSIVRSGL